MLTVFVDSFSGDLVLDVNGENLSAVTHRQAVEALRYAPAISRVTIQRGHTPPHMSSPDAVSSDGPRSGRGTVF